MSDIDACVELSRSHLDVCNIIWVVREDLEFVDDPMSRGEHPTEELV